MANAEPADLELYYDGLCRICSREVDALRRLDGGRGRLRFIDIAAPEFDPVAVGRSEASLMARIHGRDPDGEWLEGMAVLRRAYAAVGRGWLLAPTGWPLLRPLFDAGYRWFARNRYWLSGGRIREGDRCMPPTEARPPGRAED